MDDKILESIAYILPAVVTGFVAQYMFKGFLVQQNNEKKIEMLSRKKSELLPTKLQAYERMLIFCDRINPIKLVMRTLPNSDSKEDYKNLLINTIEQEFEHNLVQQLYLTDEAWSSILGLKKIIKNQIKQIADNSKTVQEFRNKIFLNEEHSQSKIDIVNSVLKIEVRKLL